jgi:hypothetical protein
LQKGTRLSVDSAEKLLDGIILRPQKAGLHHPDISDEQPNRSITMTVTEPWLSLSFWVCHLLTMRETEPREQSTI